MRVDRTLGEAARSGDEEAFASLARGSADRLFAVAVHPTTLGPYPFGAVHPTRFVPDIASIDQRGVGRLPERPVIGLTDQAARLRCLEASLLSY